MKYISFVQYSNRVFSVTHIARLDMIVQTQNKTLFGCSTSSVVENSTQIYLYTVFMCVYIPQDISCGLFYFSLKAVIIIIHTYTYYLLTYMQPHLVKLFILIFFFNSMTVSSYTFSKNKEKQKNLRIYFINLDRLDNQWILMINLCISW